MGNLFLHSEIWGENLETKAVFSSKVGVANLEQYRSRYTVATFVFI
jgi:hypothetical protein